MNSSLAEIIAQLKNTLSALKGMLKSPQDRLQQKIQFLDELIVRLQNNMQHILELSQRQAQGLLERLNALSPLAVLSRGYSLSLRLPAEAVLKDAAELKTGDQVKTILRKGSFISTVKEVFDGKGEEQPGRGYKEAAEDRG